jgi:pimeloyl-ACP methyl ester carboxylesterase
VQPLFEHRIELAGYDTRVLELEGDGTPLVLLHGFADSADTWRRLLALLGKSDRRAIAVDLPGFGAAARLDRERPMLEQYDEFAAALIDRVTGEAGADAILVGNSLGGVVSMRAAENRGSPIAGVVAIGPAGLDMPRWFGVIERDPIVRTLLSLPVPQPVLRAAVGEVYRTLAFASPRAMQREVVSAFTSHYVDRRTVRRLLHTGRRLLPELAEPFRFDRVEVPILLIWGERDRMVPHRGARKVVEALPGTRLELLPGAGHCPQVEVPERIGELIAEFEGDVTRHGSASRSALRAPARRPPG